MKRLSINLVYLLAFLIVLGMSVNSWGAKKIVIRHDPLWLLPTPRAIPTLSEPMPMVMLDVFRRDYEKVHPNVAIKFVKVVVGPERRTDWILARILAKDAPEIFWIQHETPIEKFDKGMFANVTPYLNSPNPYIEGNKKWIDTFDKGALRLYVAPDGNYYSLCFDGVGLAFYYNKQIFAKLGLTVPKTWSEMRTIEKKIKQGGFIPQAFSLRGEYRAQPENIDNILLAQFLAADDKYKQFDRDNNGWITKRERVWCINKGTWPPKPIFKEMWRIYKDWTEAFPLGFAGDLETTQLFAGGKVAMYFLGSWKLRQIKTLCKDRFDFGTFLVPAVTKKTSPLAKGIPIKLYGPWGITQYALPAYLSETRMKHAIDWLMYLSQPYVITQLDHEVEGNIPMIKGAPISREELSFISPGVRGIMLTSYNEQLDRAYDDIYLRTLALYLSGQKSLEDSIDEVMRAAKKTADRLIKENPLWIE